VENEAAKRAASFLSELGIVCTEVGLHVRCGGYIILVIGRRCIGGWRLKSDDYSVKVLENQGFQIDDWSVRMIDGKTTPTLINLNGNQSKSNSNRILRKTMREEAVIVLRKVERNMQLIQERKKWGPGYALRSA
jgi:hypothetical protein